jgi:hypothetical protein
MIDANALIEKAFDIPNALMSSVGRKQQHVENLEFDSQQSDARGNSVWKIPCVQLVTYKKTTIIIRRAHIFMHFSQFSAKIIQKDDIP